MDNSYLTSPRIHRSNMHRILIPDNCMSLRSSFESWIKVQILHGASDPHNPAWFSRMRTIALLQFWDGLTPSTMAVYILVRRPGRREQVDFWHAARPFLSSFTVLNSCIDVRANVIMLCRSFQRLWRCPGAFRRVALCAQCSTSLLKEANENLCIIEAWSRRFPTANVVTDPSKVQCIRIVTNRGFAQLFTDK